MLDLTAEGLWLFARMIGFHAPMKTLFLILVTFALAQVTGLAQTAAKGSGSGDGANSKPKTGDPIVVVRGWQVMSLTAIKRNAVTEISPEYQNKRSVGNQSAAVNPVKGQFVVILVKSQASPGLTLQQPLWVGRPDVTLVDDVGLEYPAQGRLIQQNGDYVLPGMIVGRNRLRGPRNTDTSIIYFDVPTSAQNYWLRFSAGGPLLPVGQAANLPAVVID